MEEELFELMAAAEDIQKHAVMLQKSVEELHSSVKDSVSGLHSKAEETFSALPLAVEQAGQKIRATQRQGALFVVSVGMIVAAIILGPLRIFIEYQYHELQSIQEKLTATQTELSKIPKVLEVQGEKGYWVVIDDRVAPIRLQSGLTVARLPK